MAFVTNTWISVNGDASDANSWSGGVPAANDVCVCDGTSQQSMTTGLDLSGGAFEQLLVKPQYRGQIGSPGNPLLVDVGGGTIVFRGSGQAYISATVGSSPIVVVDVNSGSGTKDSLVYGGSGVALPGKLLVLACKRGRVRLLGDVKWFSRVAGDAELKPHIYCIGDRASVYADANLAALDEVDAITITAGYMENRRTLLADGHVVVAGGELVQIAGFAHTHHVRVVGGTFQYLPTTAPASSPTLSVLAGRYDQTDEKFDYGWGNVIQGPAAMLIGGTVRGSGAWPPTLNLSDEYPGAEA